ncbi:MAG: ScyD/ScyE family protein [Anaerolineae bacterium]|nr:ScyD/ScyE family protein [Anaerolineae bacterium]
MSRRVIVLFVLCFAILTVLALPVFAQDAMPNAIASGLSNPRFVSYDADGNLWIAEAGNGGELVIPADPNAPEGAPGSTEASAGLSSQVSMVAADGTQSVAVPWLWSVATPSEQLGAMAAYSTGDALWLVMSGGGPGPQPYLGDYVLKLTNVNGFWRITDSIDLYANEAANNPDGADPLDSNVNSLAWDANGTLYIVDTGANTVYTWTEADGLSVWHSWTDDPVPTAIDFAEDGTAYVSFLGTGIAPGAGHIEHISADGSEVLETFGGLTAVTDVAVGQDGNVYAVEMLTIFGEQGPDMMSGAVVMVNADGATPVAEGLLLPYGLAQAADGSWAVSIGTLAGPGNGAVIKLG